MRMDEFYWRDEKVSPIYCDLCFTEAASKTDRYGRKLCEYCFTEYVENEKIDRGDDW